MYPAVDDSHDKTIMVAAQLGIVLLPACEEQLNMISDLLLNSVASKLLHSSCTCFYALSAPIFAHE